jgi:hypothetical protein
VEKVVFIRALILDLVKQEGFKTVPTFPDRENRSIVQSGCIRGRGIEFK